MPGSWPLFSVLQHSFTESPAVFKYSAQVEKICFIIFGAFQFLSSLFTSDRVSKRTQAFAERFKYGVITSSLLSPGFATNPVPHPHRRSFSPQIPGRLPSNHSRSTSGAESTATDQISLTIPAEPEPHVWPVTLSITLAVAALSARFYALFVLLLISTLYYMHVHRLDLHSKPDIITPSLQALQNLITAGKVWDAVVQDTLDTLENEERSIFHGPSSPIMTSSSLRVALSTSLLTTQTQCDNVRQLLSAIVSPPELAQLSEMYAPPSPMKLTFSLITIITGRFLCLDLGNMITLLPSAITRGQRGMGPTLLLHRQEVLSPTLQRGEKSGDQILAHCLVLRHHHEEAVSARQRAHQPTNHFLMWLRRTTLTPGLHCYQRARMLALELPLLIYAESTTVRV